MENVRVESENRYNRRVGIEFFVQGNIRYGYYSASAHMHNALEMLYITKGDFEIYTNGEKTTATVGEFLYFKSNTVHSVCCTSPSGGEYAVIKIRPSVLYDSSPVDKAALYLLEMNFGLAESKKSFLVMRSRH